MDAETREAVYLINDDKYLHLRENGAGVGFATYNKVTGEPLESGQISEKNLPPDGRNAISAARNWYLFELSDDDRKVIQQESVKILENIPQAGIGRRRIWEPETLPKDIRLINSHYDDLYRIPDGGVIQVDYPDGRSFTARVEHLDDYHFDMGGLGNVFHICQFAEVMERNHADFYPEMQIAFIVDKVNRFLFSAPSATTLKFQTELAAAIGFGAQQHGGIVGLALGTLAVL